MEIIRNIKEKCGKDYPVLYRISSVEYVPGGLDIEESKVIARLMEEAGADCIHCSQGVYASTHTIIPPSVFPRERKRKRYPLPGKSAYRNGR